MRVVHYLPAVRLAEGGIVRFVLDLGERLARAGHEVRLLCHDATDVPSTWGGPGARPPEVILLPRPPLGARILGPRTLGRVAATLEGAAALHVHGPWYPSNLQVARMAARAGTRAVLSPHGMLSAWSMAQRPWRKRAFLTAFMPLLRGLDLLHCTSEQERRDVAGFVAGVPARVVPPVLDLAAFERLPGPELARCTLRLPEPPTPLIVFMSRLHPKKGADLLVEAVALLRSRGARSHAVLAGAGDGAHEADLRRLIAARRLEGDVRLVGSVTGELKLSLLQAAKVVALPTHHENFGFVVPEALACGTPVLTTRGLDLWREFESSGAVWTAERSAAPFAAALERALALGEDQRRVMGARGRAWVHMTFEPAALTARYEELYALSG
ncbi:MAG: glycosyltransferase [Planctomycetes bacterium]|nr:glycosyltransferase [Planctomycetota bacterium]